MTRALLETIFGQYTPVSIVDGSGATVYLDSWAGVDWTYILGVLGFFLVLYCVLRILGSVISNV